MTINRQKAETYRVALAGGLIGPGEVVAWARAAISEGGATDPAVHALAQAGHLTIGNLLHLLGQVEGPCDTQKVLRTLFGAMHRQLQADPAKASEFTRILERLAATGFSPDPAAEVRMWSFNEMLLAAQNGTFGTIDAVRAELESFLRNYAPFAEP
jgi:hypothetical protein